MQIVNLVIFCAQFVWNSVARAFWQASQLSISTAGHPGDILAAELCNKKLFQELVKMICILMEYSNLKIKAAATILMEKWENIVKNTNKKAVPLRKKRNSYDQII